LERGSKEELVRLRTEMADLQAELQKTRDERDQAQSIANTAGTLVIAEKASHEKLLAQVKQTEAENRSLKDDLGFFEKLIPATVADGVSIRGLQAELLGENSLKWQVLIIQANKNALEFNGKLEVSFAGLQNGKAWSGALPSGAQPIKVKQYGRLEGLFELPPQVVVKSVTAKVLDGATVKATQVIKL
jgi:hypothetical protein